MRREFTERKLHYPALKELADKYKVRPAYRALLRRYNQRVQEVKEGTAPLNPEDFKNLGGELAGIFKNAGIHDSDAYHLAHDGEKLKRSAQGILDLFDDAIRICKREGAAESLISFLQKSRNRFENIKIMQDTFILGLQEGLGHPPN